MCGRWSQNNFLHVYDTFYVAQPCCTKLYDQIAVRVDAPLVRNLSSHGVFKATPQGYIQEVLQKFCIADPFPAKIHKWTSNQKHFILQV